MCARRGRTVRPAVPWRRRPGRRRCYTSGRQEAGQELTGNRPAAAGRNRQVSRTEACLPPALRRLAVHLRQVDTNTVLGRRAAAGPQSQEGLQSAREVARPVGRRAHVEREARTAGGRAAWRRGWPTCRAAARRCCSSAKAWTTTSTIRSTATRLRCDRRRLAKPPPLRSAPTSTCMPSIRAA